MTEVVSPDAIKLQLWSWAQAAATSDFFGCLFFSSFEGEYFCTGVGCDWPKSAAGILARNFAPPSC
jgi:hypothetical protein